MTEKRKPLPHAFKPGQSGNPKGKPAGTRSKSTQLLLALMDGDAANITKTVIDAAKGGDLVDVNYPDRSTTTILAGGSGE